MGRQRLAIRDSRLQTLDCRLGRQGDPERPSPFIECVEHIRFTEIDAHRPPPRTLAVIALEISIDAAERDLQRDSLHRPTRHTVEGRSHDANQMTIVLAAQVRLDLPAVLLDCRQFCSPAVPHLRVAY